MMAAAAGGSVSDDEVPVVQAAKAAALPPAAAAAMDGKLRGSKGGLSSWIGLKGFSFVAGLHYDPMHTIGGLCKYIECLMDNQKRTKVIYVWELTLNWCKFAGMGMRMEEAKLTAPDTKRITLWSWGYSLVMAAYIKLAKVVPACEGGGARLAALASPKGKPKMQTYARQFGGPPGMIAAQHAEGEMNREQRSAIQSII